MRIGMVGTRGVPARYGGFEAAVEEIGRRLVDAGHDVTVYCRSSSDDPTPDGDWYLGMRRIELPALRLKAAETFTHTALSAVAARRRTPLDVAFLFNAANSPFVPAIRQRGTAVAVHVDGLEWRRAKWGRVGRRYYRTAESLAVRWADALIADADAIAGYYDEEFGATAEVISYGAQILSDLPADGLGRFGVDPGRYHLVVARMEPENHVDLIVRGFRASSARFPLIVVGGTPYSQRYVNEIQEAAAGDDRIRLVGPVWDQAHLDQLYHHAATYLHGHSVGGTNPSLLRAMGAGAPVCAFDVIFSREVLGSSGRYFVDESSLTAEVEMSERDPVAARHRGLEGKARVASRYQWDEVAIEYEALAARLVAGASRRLEVGGRRRARSSWSSLGPGSDPAS